ncbi:MAG: pseudouridine synthase [Limnochordia bacterium]|jgi:23S rRNA pseudouridine2605 synthase
MEERVQKILAQAGYGSRRSCEELISQGRVQVNNRVVELGAKADPDRDSIMVDGKQIKKLPDYRYLMLHKPAGYLTAVTDPRKPTIMELLDGVPVRVFPVGRLDLDSEGLLFLTNDGSLTNILLHPRYGVEKTYLAEVEGSPSPQRLARLRKGVRLTDGWTSPAEVETVGQTSSTTLLRITLREGRKRQIKRMCLSIKHRVVYLKRITFGPLELGDLSLGEWRYLNKNEQNQLLQIKNKHTS